MTTSQPSHLPPMPVVTTDFDFLVGSWHVHNRRLLDPLGAASEWVEFDAAFESRTFLSGAVSVDEMSMAQPTERGLSFRCYEPATGRWAIYWVSSPDGILQPPVYGTFNDGMGQFYGEETVAGQLVHVRFTWSGMTATSAHWSQAFSQDGGATWETNWEMSFSR